MKRGDTMVLEKLERKEGFTETEKVIADYLLDFSHDIVGFTSSKMAEASYTSQTSVVRLYKKLGFNNYMVFYSTLIQEITERKNTEDIDYEQPIKASMSVDDVINTVYKFYINDLHRIKSAIDKNKFQRLYNHLRNSDIVRIIGSSNASNYTNKLANKLSYFGVNSYVVENINQLYYYRHYNNNDNVAIIFSLDQDIEMLKDMIIKLKEDNIFIFGILDNDNNELKILCDDFISLNKTNVQGIDNMGTITLVIDVIYSMFLSHYITKTQVINDEKLKVVELS